MENQQFKFDEDNAIKFIRNDIPSEVSQKYSDDEILFIIDTIWDYYEQKGFLSLNLEETEDEVMDIDDLTKYVKKEVRNDKELLMDPKDIEVIVKAELNYEESLESFI